MGCIILQNSPKWPFGHVVAKVPLGHVSLPSWACLEILAGRTLIKNLSGASCFTLKSTPGLSLPFGSATSDRVVRWCRRKSASTHPRPRGPQIKVSSIKEVIISGGWHCLLYIIGGGTSRTSHYQQRTIALLHLAAASIVLLRSIMSADFSM
jgi:hypothetical protein